ncbi:hypothetical protein [Burkholderia ubonensis]|uniref:hypothetical protein n=1 Tax=Burkholderia ubonensis TaxID=101571 RepID=UPI0012F794DC|nr:hypothetical protein [Burkholderia ubonensis]
MLADNAVVRHAPVSAVKKGRDCSFAALCGHIGGGALPGLAGSYVQVAGGGVTCIADQVVDLILALQANAPFPDFVLRRPAPA